MIETFRDAETEKVWKEGRSRLLPPVIQKTALRKLQMLNAAATLNDLTVPPRNRLERLRGDREGQYSIRVNDQYRICSSGERATHSKSKSRTITEGFTVATRKRATTATHPGEILRIEFMAPMGITAYQLAKALHSPGIYEVVRGQRNVSADLALRLGKYFGTTPQFWMNLQSDYDLRLAAGKAPLSKIKPRVAA